MLQFLLNTYSLNLALNPEYVFIFTLFPQGMDYPYYSSIANSLKSVKRPGYFAAGGLCQLPLPSLSLSSAPDDILGLPLCDCQAKLIIASSTRAPFGRGEETIIDTAVRCTWQLSPEQFFINNEEWDEQLQDLLDEVKDELGCDPKLTVSGDLYKLLLYEPGGFFKVGNSKFILYAFIALYLPLMQRHRDTEKSDGMFGTLVIQLPSKYSGGELAVYHQSKSKTFDFGGSDGYNDFHYAAFYADCQHELKPVTEGYRLCLVYNLVYSGSGSCPSPADNQKIISAVATSMKEWSNAAGDNPPLMIYMLEHHYCNASLSFKSLKNSDRAVADVLTLAKKEFAFDLYVAKVNVVEEWGACQDFRGGDFTAEDKYAEHITAENLLSLKGHGAFSSIEITRDFFVPKKFFESQDPDREDFSETTGNEGATCDKEYNWAALLLWPSRNCIRNVGVDDNYDTPV
jgi:hypothetical protein